MRLMIKNFASLSSIDIFIRDFTVIIGEQSSGKSLTSKVYFFLMDAVPKLISNSIIEESELRKIQNPLKKEFTKLFPEYSWKQQGFEIQAFNIITEKNNDPDISITYNPGGNGIRFSFSESYKRDYKKVKKSIFYNKKRK